MSQNENLKCTKFVYVSVAHRYWNEQWSDEKNVQIYGADASSEGIGSNMRIEITLVGASDSSEIAVTGALAHLKAKVDHQCLFLPPFGVQPPTLENITQELARELALRPPEQGKWQSLTVWETERLACTHYFSPAATELKFKLFNLTLDCQNPVNSETGLSLGRADVIDKVREVFFNQAPQNPDLNVWSRQLFETLRKSIECLGRLRIDLGSHEYLLVHSDPIMSGHIEA